MMVQRSDNQLFMPDSCQVVKGLMAMGIVVGSVDALIPLASIYEFVDQTSPQRVSYHPLRLDMSVPQA